MFAMFKNWYIRHFSDPQAVALLGLLLFSFFLLYFFGNLLAPLLIAIVFAYLLEWPIRMLTKHFKFPRSLATIFVVGCFFGCLIFTSIVLTPILWNQATSLIHNLPYMFERLNVWLMDLPQQYPEIVDTQIIDSLFNTIKEKSLAFGESALKLSLTSLLSLVTLGVYAFLVPLMTFFLLKDKEVLIAYISRFLPRNRTLVSQVWQEMRQQIANYIQGKIFEIIIVAIVSYIIFLFFGLNYALLLALAVGISVLVPYIGAVIVTIPIIVVAIFQFGIGSTFWYLMIAYIVSQLLDGNLLVPFLFSEAVNLHPLTIIIAVIIFGGLWGFWGVFFAIPLATLVKSVVNAWSSTVTADTTT
ncbi:AI-2E family transporter [Pelistega ratti]|uniref:AI-2E family transporter n=1 Tax=Pelistega ratti TaxID=2652177 RepID=UPI0013593389|nr:AI-2E family transporter [Pelistega ratti]